MLGPGLSNRIATLASSTFLVQNEIQCRQWDDQFLAIFQATILLGIAVWLSRLLWPLGFPPRSWWATRPFGRAALASIAGVLPALLLTALSKTQFLLSLLAIPLVYKTACPNIDFGGAGFFERFGREGAAVVQQGTMLVIVSVALAAFLVVGSVVFTAFGRRLSRHRLPRPAVSD